VTALDLAASERQILTEIRPFLGAAGDLLSFASLLFADGSEDLDRYPPHQLAELARSAFEAIASRRRGEHKVRGQRRMVDSGQGPRPVTAIEIVNDDMPFLVDSIVGELQARSISLALILHPIFKVRRSPQGELEKILGPGDRNWNDGTQESYILLLMDALPDSAADGLAAALSAVLDDVRLAVTDWPAMVQRLDRAIAQLERRPPDVAPDLLSESLAFCRWLRDGQFTFLGARDYRLEGNPETGELAALPETGLGVLRNPDLHVLRRADGGLAMTPEMRSQFLAPSPLVVNKSSIFSRVHRRAFMDYIGIKTYGADGAAAGQLRIVGLLTSQAYTQPPDQIPFLRHKVATVIQRSGFAPGSHAGKAFANVLATFPRDELFQIGEERLLVWVRGIVDLELRPRVRVFARPDRFDRFVSVLVYVPRDRFSTVVRERIAALLTEAYAGQLTAFTPYFPEGPLVRIHFIIGRNQGPRPEVDEAALEREITAVTRTWEDRLATAMDGAGLGGLTGKYQQAFPVSYAEIFSPERALEDIERMERLSPERPLAIDFHRDRAEAGQRIRAAIYRLDRPVPLSERVPVLENFGFSVIYERSYRLTPRFAGQGRDVALHDMVLETSDGAPIDLGKLDVRMEAAFLAVCRGEADNDSFNQLVIRAGADWREAAVMRAYAAFLRQMRAPFGLRYIADTLSRHAGVARDLIELFHARFDPDRSWSEEERAKAAERIRHRIEGALTVVPSLDEDRILRHYLNLMAATVRTNFFQRDSQGTPPRTIAFKLASQMIERLEEPRPFREIWVYSPRVEGVHLRFAPVARGGIRWSDRAQDFRTEVFGLAKAQQVKNAVIVPAGAKGGFLPKQLPRSAERDAIMAEGIAAYRLFVSTLLDMTDNILDGRVVPPERVVRYDGDDPYLVVAADKGTATFSDFANEIARQHDFWLGDAFASGGSHGYDHKGMGITARGAWECVKRHFREMDIDIQTTPFRVVGVGDMSGDVFGNGMLMSRKIKLVAAFDHRDIFIDPDPDPEASFAERQRLFEKPRSSWQDYDKSRISRGGGVFSRSAKSIAVTPETRSLLGIEAQAVTPVELIRAVLRCEADLLWFGGIGTYVKASSESDEDVGDRVNDALRITGSELRAKVVGEGANLAVTQRGRIEYASRGGRINTDFIDNSAGVNCSDQEVNIKIVLAPAVVSGRLEAEERDRLLVSMTDDVAAACLANNYQQSLALSLAERHSPSNLAELGRLMQVLEARALIDRKLEALPSAEELIRRQAAGAGLTRPELAVLLSFAKIGLSADLIASRAPDEPGCEALLIGYFPPALRHRFSSEIGSHRLRREIIVTTLVNSLINRGGPAIAVRLADETGREPGDVALAYLAAAEVFDIAGLWQAIDQLDGKISGNDQLALYGRVREFLIERTGRFLRHGMDSSLSDIIAVHRAAIAEMEPVLDEAATPRQLAAENEARACFEGRGAPAALAARLARLDLLGHSLAITWLAQETGREIATVARIALAAADYLRLDELKARAAGLPIRDYYDQLALSGAIHAIESARRALASEVLLAPQDGTFDFSAWERSGGQRLARTKALLDEVAQGPELTVSRLTVIASQLRDLVIR
jgi:glutamate dehydrogenase